MENLVEIKFESLPKGRWGAREEALEKAFHENFRSSGKHLHLVYDRRLSPTLLPNSENRYVISPGILKFCRKVTIINEDGSSEVIKGEFK